MLGIVAFGTFDVLVLVGFAIMVTRSAAYFALAFFPIVGLMNCAAAVGADAVFPVVVYLGVKSFFFNYKVGINGRSINRLFVALTGCSLFFYRIRVRTVVSVTSRALKAPRNRLRLLIHTLPNVVSGNAEIITQSAAIGTLLLTLVYVFPAAMGTLFFRMRMRMDFRHRQHGHDHGQCHYPGKNLSLHVVLLS